MFYFPSLFRGNSFNAPATTDNKERNQSEEKTPPDTDYPEPLDPASLKKIAHMEDSKKLNLLKFKWKPEENFKFPSRNSRRYNPRWECDFPWLRYSKSEDSVYCGYCLVFAKSGNYKNHCKNWKFSTLWEQHEIVPCYSVLLIQKNRKRGEFLAFIYCSKMQKCLSFRGLRPLDPHQGSTLDPLGGLQRPPDPQLCAAMTYGHCKLRLRRNTRPSFWK